MRIHGKISRWKDDKGFGFITPDAGGAAVFVHIKSFADTRQRPAANVRVSYALRRDAQGRMQAVQVTPSVPSATPSESSVRNVGAVIFAAGFLLLLLGASMHGAVPRIVLWVYVGASSMTFIAYALDKAAARSGRWRIPENTLHGLSLVGGWPGAMVAQRLLRHKSKKLSFQIFFWLTVLVNCALLLWVLSRSNFVTG